MNFHDLYSLFFKGKISILIILIILTLILVKILKRKNHPPGPNIFVGSSVLFRPMAFKYIDKLTKQYGPIMRLSLFGQSMIVLGNYDVIKEAFVKHGDYFTDRPKSDVIQEYCNYKGVALSSGELWKENRKFALNYLLKPTHGESIENIILEEIGLACNEINKRNGKSFNPKHLVFRVTHNIISELTGSERTEYDVPVDFIEANIDPINYYFRMSNPANFFSPLKYILKSHKDYKQAIHNIKSHLINIIKQHEIFLDENNIRDYIDAFLLKEREEKKTGTSDPLFTREQLIISIMDFYLAGSGTTANTFLWILLFLLHHPLFQIKIQKEIDQVIGSSRSPRYSDLSNLHFTYATILESQRYANVVPLAVTRIVTEDIKLLGYEIEKGSFVVPNLTAVHFDPKYWKNPLSFDPHRFLDDNSQLIQNIQSLLPFSSGNRECLGESLAKKELFLLFTSLLQRYTLNYSDQLPSMTEFIEGTTINAYPFTVSFIPR